MSGDAVRSRGERPDGRGLNAATSAAPAPLTGALGTVALADVLQLLELGRKSGVLAVDAGDGRRGLVRLTDGGVAGARYQDVRARPAQDTRDVYDAVGALLALSDGRFAFTASRAAEHDTPRLRVEAVLMTAFQRADERARAAAAPATPAQPAAEPARDRGPRANPWVDASTATWAGAKTDHTAAPAHAGAQGHRTDGPRAPATDAARVPVLAAPPAQADASATLRSAHWAVLAAVDGVRTADAVVAASGRDPEGGRRALGELMAAGLVAFRAEPGLTCAADVPPAAARSSAF